MRRHLCQNSFQSVSLDGEELVDLETTGALSTVKGLLQESEGLGSETQSESRVKGEEPIDRARKETAW